MSQVTDDACSAAILAGKPDRIQGFHYPPRYVIRDIWADPGRQEIWECGEDEENAYLRFQHQCEVERTRILIAAALPLIDPAGGGEGKAVVKQMVDRFLSWKLPEDFSPDCGISFVRDYNVGLPGIAPAKHEPVGTNLLSYTQAEAMVRHMLEDLPPPSEDSQIAAGVWEAIGKDDALADARRKLSMREFWLIIKHARAAVSQSPPEPVLTPTGAQE